MKVDIAISAKKNLEDIFIYHLEYSFDFASAFQAQITDFFLKNLRDFPSLGALYNSDTRVRKLIFQDYNIYYIVTEEIVTVLFVIHESNSFNQDLGD